MKLGRLLEYLRNQHGLHIPKSRIHLAITEGRLSRPTRDTDGRYDFAAANVNEIVALWKDGARAPRRKNPKSRKAST